MKEKAVIFISLFMLIMMGCQNINIDEEEPNSTNEMSDKYSQLEKVSFDSPSENIKFELFEDESNFLSYLIKYNGDTIVGSSKLGFINDGVNYGINNQIGTVNDTSNTNQYSFLGKKKLATDQHNNYLVPFYSQEAEQEFQLEVRVWDDGLALRYHFPSEFDGIKIDKELTTYTLSIDGTAYFQSNTRDLQDSHRIEKISDLLEGETLVSTSTFKIAPQDIYVSITEAELKDYAGMALRHDGDGVFNTHFWMNTSGFEADGKTSPWRVLMIAEDLNKLYNNTLVQNVSEPVKEKLINADWIHPGKAINFNYFDLDNNLQVEEARRHLEASQELGIQHQFIGNSWRNRVDNLEEGREVFEETVALVEEYGQHLWIGQDVLNLDENGISLYDEQTRKDFFAKVKEIGFAGIKIGHIENENPTGVNVYYDIAQDAAEKELMLIYHNSNKPTGLQRTYPNVLGKEAIKGMQFDYDANNATIIPFTRLIPAGADYQPIHFSNYTRQANGTWSAILASSIIMQSNILTFNESPIGILKNEASNLLKELPATWDETIVLPDSEVGELVVMARRKGNDWYLAAINSEYEAKTLTVELDFLDLSHYETIIYSDDLKNRSQFSIENNIYNSGDELQIDLDNGGGFVARFKVKE